MIMQNTVKSNIFLYKISILYKLWPVAARSIKPAKINSKALKSTYFPII